MSSSSTTVASVNTDMIRQTEVGTQAVVRPRIFHTSAQTDLIPELLKLRNREPGHLTGRSQLSISKFRLSRGGPNDMMSINKGLGFMTNARASLIQPAQSRRGSPYRPKGNLLNQSVSNAREAVK